MSVFFALDVETANVDRSSICQIGLVLFKNGIEQLAWETLIDPECEFDPYHSSIHGIQAEDVTGKPRYADVHTSISEMVKDHIIVHHSSFDKTAFQRCFVRNQVTPFACDWLDNTAVVRRVWREFAQKGYGLKNLADVFQMQLTHHDALSDARIAGEIFCKALNETGTTPEDWCNLVRKPILPKSSSSSVARNGFDNGMFSGENIVFTGALRESRSECADRAAKVGFNVQNGVTKKTSYLCVGIQDPSVLGGNSKSSKHRKAEKYQNDGQDIAIISEEDFWDIVSVEFVS